MSLKKAGRGFVGAPEGEGEEVIQVLESLNATLILENDLTGTITEIYQLRGVLVVE